VQNSPAPTRTATLHGSASARRVRVPARVSHLGTRTGPRLFRRGSLLAPCRSRKLRAPIHRRHSTLRTVRTTTKLLALVWIPSASALPASLRRLSGVAQTSALLRAALMSRCTYLRRCGPVTVTACSPADTPCEACHELKKVRVRAGAAQRARHVLTPPPARTSVPRVPAPLTARASCPDLVPRVAAYWQPGLARGSTQVSHGENHLLIDGAP